MEEALWHLEDQWKLSTHKAIAVFSSTCLLLVIIALCFLLALWRNKHHSRSRGTIHQEPPPQQPPPMGRRSTVAGTLIGTGRWSGACKWDREAPTALLVKQDNNENEVGWGSHNSSSAVWRKPILMGEKCELPSFSGLILYDQRGFPLDPRFHEEEEEAVAMHVQDPEESPALVRTTLKDFL